MSPPTKSKTKQGYELQWGTNVVGHFDLQKLLLPLLQASAQDDGEARSHMGIVRLQQIFV
jgi:protochlorophyllide reductase